MGTALANIIVEAERIGGLQGKLMLADITRMTTGQANSVADTPELIAQFKKALDTLKGSIKSSATPDQLRKHITGFVDLMTQRSLVLETARRINELATESLSVVIDPIPNKRPERLFKQYQNMDLVQGSNPKVPA